MRVLAASAALAAALLTVSCTVFVGHQPSESSPVARSARHTEHPAEIGIPPGQLPHPGMCRVWLPGRPPGQQAEQGPCSRLADEVPPGAWLVYHPSGDRKHVEVTEYHPRRPGVVVAIRVYDAMSGQYVREGQTTAAR